jgi:hypothetical protein
VIDCQREQEVVDAIASGRWPKRVAAELTTHVAGCAVCQDVALIAAVIDADYEQAWRHVRVPSSAHVWWRAQMRARRDATRAAARPITLVQGLAAASTAGLAAAGVGYLSGTSLWARFISLVPDAAAATQAFRDTATGVVAAAASLPHVELVAAAGLVLLLMPAALFFVFSEK